MSPLCTTRKSRRTLTLPVALGTAFSLPLLAAAPFAQADGAYLPAKAGDFSFKIESGVAFPLTDPQSERFQLGGSQTLKALWALNPYFDLGPSATFLTLPAESAQGDFGTAWAFGGGLRLKRPHHASGENGLSGISPWVDADALYVRTGPLNRPAFAIGGGLAIPVDDARSFWVGPFVRYMHIVQGEKTGFNSDDAKVITVGLSLEMGAAVRREPEVVIAAVPQVVQVPQEPQERIVIKKEAFCPDGDNDKVPDSVDRCPQVVGTLDGYGCPNYKKIIVKPDKLELKEKLYFAWNEATLQPVSYPVLDEVVQALNENKNFRVQVEGHTSSEGGDDHNQTLSERRAAAVLDYLVKHGVSKDRLVSKGFASTVPIDTNKTAAGRENNRRVEFVVNFIILNDGSR